MDQASPFKLIVWAGVYLLAVLLIICGLSGVHYIHRLARERDGWNLYQARLKLSIVATFSARRARGSGVVDEEPDLEANVDECPICIGSLESETDDESGEEMAGEETAINEETGLVSSDGRRPPPDWTSSTSRSGLVNGQEVTGNPAAAADRLPRESDVLTLNSCGHVFHTKCLATWLAMDRRDCPVCREEYYSGPSVIMSPRRTTIQRRRG